MDNTVFISYAHQDTGLDRIAAFVQYLHDCLPSKIEILLDRKYLGIGKNIPNYMEKLKISPVAIVLLTPEYKRRVEGGTGGVFFEYKIIRDRLLNDNDFLLLPILFEGTASTSIPDILQDEIYEDFLKFQPRRRRKSVTSNKYYLSDNNREIFIPKFTEIARAIESRITVRTVLPKEKHQQLLEELFVKTKITREWVKLHPEFYNHLFVYTHSYHRIKEQSALFLIGRKGTGKSTIASTLPEIEHDKYKTCIAISADYINLKSTFELFDYDNQSETITHKLGNYIKEFSQLSPTQFFFKFAWLGTIYICLAKELCELGRKNLLNEQQRVYLDDLINQYEDFTFQQSQDIPTSKYFTLASVAFSEFWGKIVSDALELKDFSQVIRYIDSTLNEENYLHFLLPEKLLKLIRAIVSHCDQYALVTLDDFDSVFSIFRKSLEKKSINNLSELSSKSLEASWIQALMLLILELKGYREGWRDKVFEKLDFCITIPRDSYLQVIYSDRDAYLSLECTVDLEWTGIYLARMLVKRLCYMYDEVYNEQKDVFSELNRIIRTFTRKLPTSLTFDFNNERVSIDLFCYVLRHTFWRPRDVLTYYASLMTAALSCPDQDKLTVEQVRRIIGLTTKNVIQTEFIGEYQEVIPSLEKILYKFRRAPQVLTYDEIIERINKIDFIIKPKGPISDNYEKLRILYEIGFIGLLLAPDIAEEENVTSTECFYFNEGSSIFESAQKNAFSEYKFLIHPIFVEKLKLNYKMNHFILHYNDKYLRDNHVVRSAVLNAC